MVSSHSRAVNLHTSSIALRVGWGGMGGGAHLMVSSSHDGCCVHGVPFNQFFCADVVHLLRLLYLPFLTLQG